MKCTRCGTSYSPRTAGQEPRLHCNQCGTRLFAWLGDPFGTRDAVAAPPVRQHNSGSSQAGLILLAIFIFVAFFSCICIYPYIS